MILDPRVFIIGGGVSEAGELPAGPAREAFQAKLTARGHRAYRPTGPPLWFEWPSWVRKPG